METIHIERAGRVTWRNHDRLGLERITRGVYGRALVCEGMSTWQARRARFLRHVRAVLAAYEDREVVPYGVTALQILGVALPERLQDWDRVHILVPAGTTRPARQGVVAHSTERPWQVWGSRDGIFLLHPVDHWLQLRGTDDELIEVADGLVRRQHPLITMVEFRARLGELTGVAGVKRARRLMGWVRPGTDSLYETRTRLILVHGGLPCPAVNPEVHSRSGITYFIDMAYEEEQVGVEYDGADHVGSRDQMEDDALRRRNLQDDGWYLITVTAKQHREPATLVRSVEAALILRRATRNHRRGAWSATALPKPGR